MQRRVVVSVNDDCRAETTQSLSKFGMGSYSGKHIVREFFQKSTASRCNSRFTYELPILLRAANARVPDKNSPSAIGGNFERFASTYCSHCSTRGSDDAFLIFRSKQTVPILQTRGTLDLLEWRNERNSWHLKQKHVS